MEACISRLSITVLVIRPTTPTAAAGLMLVAGRAKCGVFERLKQSRRNFSLTFSAMLKVLEMAVSRLRRPGPYSTPRAESYGIRVQWNPTDDDFLPKAPELLKRGVDFALEALDDPEARLYVHCAAGVHRAPMMTLAVLCAMEWKMETAMALIETRRPAADFADVYIERVRRFLDSRVESEARNSE